MKKILLALVILSLAACSDVPSGYTGIKVNLLGSDKGVDSQELGTGRYWIGMNEKLYTFPVFQQTQVWTKNVDEGSLTDDSVTFQSEKGLSVNSDISVVYSVDPKKVSVLFQKFRKGIDEITHTFLRSAVRDALVRSAGTKSIESIYGAGKADLINEVESKVRAETADLGIIIEHIYFIGDMRLPPSITAAINANAVASQMTAQREQEVQQVKFEADKLEQTARGEANSKLILAEAEAKSIKIKGDALSKNPEVLELSKIEKWNGEVPQVVGATTPFISLSK